jgi:hypothetical protein
MFAHRHSLLGQTFRVSHQFVERDDADLLCLNRGPEFEPICFGQTA